MGDPEKRMRSCLWMLRLYLGIIIVGGLVLCGLQIDHLMH